MWGRPDLDLRRWASTAFEEDENTVCQGGILFPALRNLPSGSITGINSATPCGSSLMLQSKKSGKIRTRKPSLARRGTCNGELSTPLLYVSELTVSFPETDTRHRVPSSTPITGVGEHTVFTLNTLTDRSAQSAKYMFYINLFI